MPIQCTCTDPVMDYVPPWPLAEPSSGGGSHSHESHSHESASGSAGSGPASEPTSEPASGGSGSGPADGGSINPDALRKYLPLILLNGGIGGGAGMPGRYWA